MMSLRPASGRHLYNQIVIPLVVVSVGLVVVASVLAAYYLNGLTTFWVDQGANNAVSTVADRYNEYARQMQHVAEVAAADPQLAASVSAGDKRQLARTLGQAVSISGYTNAALLDASGAVLGSAGESAPATGTRPFGTLERSASAPATIGAAGTQVRLAGGRTVLAALVPVSTASGSYTLAVTRAVDDSLIAELARGSGSTFCIYTPGLARVARSLSPSVTAGARERLDAALGADNAAIKSVLSTASDARVVPVRLAGGTYELTVRTLRGSGASPGAPDGYLLGVIDDSAAQGATKTSMTLLLVWSTVAIMVLMALGFWVARRVSDPIVELDEGARRIADGDFSTKVDVHGRNEIARLSETFNEMTDSLRQRSEVLTKKVLELATLYEMSRSLGSTLEMDELLGSVLESALRIFDLDVGYIALRDKETGTLQVRAVLGGELDLVGGGDAVRSSMAGWVVREARPLIFNPDPATDKSRIDSLTRAKAALCVPLVSSEGTIGAMTVGSNDQEYRFTSDDVRLLSTIGNHVTIAIGNIELFSQLQDAYFATVRSLAAAVDAKDTYTRGHSDRVATYAVLVAERLNLSHEQRTALEMAAYLHDIGKIGVPESILLKPGALTVEEMSQMRHHPLIGADILKPVSFPWAITPIVRHHHEHWDGSGYPAGLRGEEIPVLARILCVADSFEAMTADRPYREGRSYDDALEELKRCSGTQFDPAIVAVLTEIVEEQRNAGDDAIGLLPDEVGIDDARAIFSALVAGVLASFRRLGGPRLASNIEVETDEYFRAESMSFALARGHVTFDEDAKAPPAEEIACMRRALRHLDAAIGRVSGGTLVDHFYEEALEGLSTRMGRVAGELGFLLR